MDQQLARVASLGIKTLYYYFRWILWNLFLEVTSVATYATTIITLSIELETIYHRINPYKL